MGEKALIDILWVAVCSFLVFIMQAGFLCVEAGQSRSKNFINVALKNILDAGIAVLAFWFVGYGLMFGASHGGWIGGTEFLPSLNGHGVWSATFFVFQTMFCSTAVTILSGAVAERVRIVAYALISVVISAVIYPIAGHWVWNGQLLGEVNGWLAQLGFIDFAGSTVVHSLGGWIALAALLQIGPRTGRFPEGQPPQRIPGADIPLSVLGVLFLLFGWFGFNGGSTLAFNDIVPRIIANTLLSSSAAMIAAAVLSLLLTTKIEVDWTMNGALAGAVSITACCHCVSPPMAIVVGAIGGLICVGTTELLEKLKIDDVVGAVPVHLTPGIWGTLAVGIFGAPELIGTGLSRGQQLVAQLTGIAAVGTWAFGVAWIAVWTIGRISRLRVTPEEEAIGLNVSEHDASTEILDFFRVMDTQATSGDLTLRVPEEPFTEVGQIARRYNRVIDKLETSVARTDAIIRTSQAAILTVTERGYLITGLNPAGEEMFRTTSREAEGTSATTLLDLTTESDPDTPQPLASLLGRLAEERRLAEFRVRRADASRLPVEIAVARSTVAGESFYTLTITDLSARHAADVASRVGRDERRALLESMDESVVITDERGQIREYNDAAAGFLGLGEGDVGGSIDRIFPRGVRDRIRYGVTRLVATRNDPTLGQVIETNVLGRGDRETPARLIFRRIEVTGSVSLLLLLRPPRAYEAAAGGGRFQSLPF
jgi:Amt family ammonium transporter